MLKYLQPVASLMTCFQLGDALFLLISGNTTQVRQVLVVASSTMQSFLPRKLLYLKILI